MGDRPYVVLGNFWLAMALILKLGQKAHGQWAGMYRFFGIGGALSSAFYWFLILACLVIGIALVSYKKHS